MADAVMTDTPNELDTLLKGGALKPAGKPTRQELKVSKHKAQTRNLQQEANNSPEGMVAIPDALLFPLKRIQPTTDQPRSEFDQQKVDTYAKDMARRHAQGRGVAGSGILQPLLVRWEPGAVQMDGTVRDDAKVLITAGETRYHAAIKAGLTHVPVNIVDADSEQAYEDALAENLLRTDLSPEDEGRAFLYFKNRYNLTYPQLADRLFHDQSRVGYIQNRIDALRIDPEMHSLIGRSALSVSAARQIQTIKDPVIRKQLLDWVLENKANLRELDKKKKELVGSRVYGQVYDKNPARTARRLAQQGITTDQQLVSETASVAGAVAGSDSPYAGDFGSRRSTTEIVLPRFDLGNALGSVDRHLADIVDAAKPARLGPEAKKKYAKQARELKAHLDQLIELFS